MSFRCSAVPPRMKADPRIYNPSLASYSHYSVGAAYVRCMVVKAQVVVYDGVVRMVGFEEMLQRSRSLLGCCLDVVDLDGWQIDLWIVAASHAEK